LRTAIARAKERGRVRKCRAGSESEGACGIAGRGWEQATPGCRVDGIDLDVLDRDRDRDRDREDKIRDRGNQLLVVADSLGDSSVSNRVSVNSME